MLHISKSSYWQATQGKGVLAGSSFAYDFTSGQTPTAGPALSVSRLSGAMQYNAQGYREYANENLLIYSEDPSGAGWTRTNSTVTPSSDTPPSPYQQAWIYDEGTAAGVEHRLDANFTAVAGVTYEGEVVLKAGSTGTCYLFFGSAATWGGAIYGLTINLLTGQITNSSVANYGIVDLGNGWYKVWFYQTASAAGFPGLRILTQNGTYTGTNRTILVTGAKVSRGTQVRPYLKTTASPVFTPRIDYNPTTLATRGYLIEPQRTNLLLNSNEFSSASWTNTDSTVTPNSGLGASGGVDMDFIQTGSLGTDAISQAFTITAGSTLAASIDLKKGTLGDWVRLQVSDGTSSTGFRCWFNMNTGALGLSAAFGTGTLIGTSVTYLAASGVYRVSIVGIVDAATTTTVRFYQISADNNNSTVRLANSNRYQGHAQVEVGTCASSVIVTGAAQVTRSTDLATTTDLSWYNGVEGTMYFEGETFETVTSQSGCGGWLLDDGASANRMGNRILSSGGGNQSLFFVSTGGVVQAAHGFSPVATNTVYKFASVYGLNNMTISRNGAGPLVDSSGTIPAVNVFYFGFDRALATTGCLWVRKFGYWPYQRSNADLVSMTS